MSKLVVLLCVVAMAAAKPSVGVVPLTYGLPVSSVSYGVPAVSSVSAYSSGVVHGAPLAYSSLYAPGVLAQPAHSPAVVLDAALGVPLDTPEVVAARAAHYQAKAFSLHHLKKRSLGVAPVAPLTYGAVSPFGYSAYSPVAYSSPLITPYSASLVASPLAYHGLAPKALSVHPW